MNHVYRTCGISLTVLMYSKALEHNVCVSSSCSFTVVGSLFCISLVAYSSGLPAQPAAMYCDLSLHSCSLQTRVVPVHQSYSLAVCCCFDIPLQDFEQITPLFRPERFTCYEGIPHPCFCKTTGGLVFSAGCMCEGPA